MEFLVQLGQLKHGHGNSEIRAGNTLVALAALHHAGHLSDHEYRALESSYLFCTRVRMRLHLQAGRAMDSLPTEPADLARLASSLGFDRASELREQYRRVTRRARQVFKERFYD